MTMAVTSRPRPGAHALLLVLLSLAALALRLWNLGGDALSPDEGSSYFFSQLPLATLLWSLCDPHPPGYYLLLRGIAMMGTEAWWLRLPSALAGTLAVPMTWAVARAASEPSAQPGARWPRQAALFAAALVAVAPLAVWYSREARSYALLALLALVLVWTALRWLRRPSLAAAAAFLLAGWLALWTEYGALVILWGLNLLALSGWPWRPDASGPSAPGRRWLALQAALLAPFGLWWLASAQRDALAQMSYQAIFLAVQAQRLGLDWTPEQASRVIAAALLAAAGVSLGLALAVRRSRRMRRWLGSRWVAVLLMAAVLALGVWGALPRLYTVKRHLNALLPFLSVAAAWAWFYARPGQAGRGSAWRWAAGGAVALLLALTLAMPRLAPQAPWPRVVAVLQEQLAPGDALWVDELDAPAFAYAWGERDSWQPLRARDLAALNGTPQERRVWLLGSVTPYRDLRQTLPLEFASQRAVAASFHWPGVALTAYDASDTPQPWSEPSQALRWGLGVQSPLDVLCP